jgi:hypothetical protein
MSKRLATTLFCQFWGPGWRGLVAPGRVELPTFGLGNLKHSLKTK